MLGALMITLALTLTQACLCSKAKHSCFHMTERAPDMLGISCGWCVPRQVGRRTRRGAGPSDAATRILDPARRESTM